MAVRSKPVQPERSMPELSRRKIAAVVITIISWYTTWLFVESLGGSGLLGVGAATVLEWLTWEARREIIAGKISLSSVVATAVDTIFNAGGLWAWILKIDNSDAYQMLAQSLGLGDEMRLLPALLIALAIGLYLSLSPFKLWRDE